MKRLWIVLLIFAPAGLAAEAPAVRVVRSSVIHLDAPAAEMFP